jgi:hypothetical protein
MPDSDNVHIHAIFIQLWLVAICSGCNMCNILQEIFKPLENKSEACRQGCRVMAREDGPLAIAVFESPLAMPCIPHEQERAAERQGE